MSLLGVSITSIISHVRFRADAWAGREVNTTLTLSPMTDEPMIIMTDGSICPNNPGQTASTAIRVRCHRVTLAYLSQD